MDNLYEKLWDVTEIHRKRIFCPARLLQDVRSAGSSPSG
jgi:transposase